MRDNRVYLRVKIRSLAVEAKIIRQEERKARERQNRDLRLGLADHRRGIVRREARATLLAYGFLRGVPYEKIEPKCHLKPDWYKVARMILKYGIQRDWSGETGDQWKTRLGVQEEQFKKWSGTGIELSRLTL